VKRALRGEALGDAQPIHTMHPGEMRGDLARLIGLYPPDEVPGERQVGERGDLAEGLLQVALAEMLMARARGRPHDFGRLGLADRQ